MISKVTIDRYIPSVFVHFSRFLMSGLLLNLAKPDNKDIIYHIIIDDFTKHTMITHGPTLYYISDS